MQNRPDQENWLSHLSIFFITEFATGGEDRAVGGGIGDMEENQLLRVVSERGETEAENVIQWEFEDFK